MDSFKEIAKGGWHPKAKDGGSSSGGGGKVAGWLGRGKDTTSYAYSHQSTPLSALKDPESFGPPPKRYTSPDGGTSTGTASASAGFGSALSPDQIRRDAARQQTAAQKEEPAPPPSGPYRVDTTGINTANLPKPPVRRADGLAPPPPPVTMAKPKPSLPPRLPPRSGGTSTIPASPPPAYTETVPDSSDNLLNQGAVDRLGRAGVSVPGLGIGKSTAPAVPMRAVETSPPAPQAAPIGHVNQLGELQSRFSKMSAASPTSSSQGTSWEQKRAALKTASDFQKDPSSVSFSDMRSAASTANNFRERHGEQVAAGWKTASGLNDKYGIAARVKGVTGESDTTAQTLPEPSSASNLGRRPPPPLPAKKKELAPPPVPLGSKPKPA